MLTPSLLKSTFHSSLLKGEKKKSNIIYSAAGLISIIHTFFHPLLSNAVFGQVAYNKKETWRPRKCPSPSLLVSLK